MKVTRSAAKRFPDVLARSELYQCKLPASAGPFAEKVSRYGLGFRLQGLVVSTRTLAPDSRVSDVATLTGCLGFRVWTLSTRTLLQGFRVWRYALGPAKSVGDAATSALRLRILIKT